MLLGYHLADFIDPRTGRVRADTDIEAVARAALRREYELTPVGSETTSDLENRIVGIFVQRYGWNWNKDTPPDQIIGDVNFHNVVSEISPLSRRRIRPANLTQAPKPGSKTAPWMSADQILSLVDTLFGAYTLDQQRRIASELMQRQQERKPIYIPPGTERSFSATAAVGLGLGAVAVLGLVGYLAFSAGKGKRK